MTPIDLSSYESCRDEFQGVSRATLDIFSLLHGQKGSNFLNVDHFDRIEQSSGFSVLARSLL